MDVGTRRLLRNEEELHLSPKAFELLILLIENRAQAMSKVELQQKLWPSTYVLETNLAGLVAEIRHVLGDPATIPGASGRCIGSGTGSSAAVSEHGAQRRAVPTHATYWVVWETRQIPLMQGENILGRAPDAAVWIDAPGVSRHHARISLEAAKRPSRISAAKTARTSVGSWLPRHRIGRRRSDSTGLGCRDLRIPSPAGSPRPLAR